MLTYYLKYTNIINVTLTIQEIKMKDDLMTESEVIETLSIAVKKAMDEVNKIPMEQWDDQGFDVYFKLERLLEKEVYSKIFTD